MICKCNLSTIQRHLHPEVTEPEWQRWTIIRSSGSLPELKESRWKGSKVLSPDLARGSPAVGWIGTFYTRVSVCSVCLTTVFMKDVGEAVQNAVATATVGAAFLNPLSMRNRPTAPSDRGA